MVGSKDVNIRQASTACCYVLGESPPLSHAGERAYLQRVTRRRYLPSLQNQSDAVMMPQMDLQHSKYWALSCYDRGKCLLGSEEVVSVCILLCDAAIYAKNNSSFLVSAVSLATLKKVAEKLARKSLDCVLTVIWVLGFYENDNGYFGLGIHKPQSLQ
jgi:hypothetical protein